MFEKIFRPFNDSNNQIAIAADIRARSSTHQDKLAWFALAALFVVMLIATWQRWTHPIIDHGREMNLPTRILAGERLYVDILYYYGPFAPYFNALLYRVFGIHLTTLHVSGGVCAVLILAMIYWLARRLMSVWQAALATALVMLICALNVYLGNYIQPYSYAVLYGLVFALASLVCAIRYLQSQSRFWLCLAGISAGLVAICKPELMASAIAPSGVALVLVCFAERRWPWREAMIFTLPVLVICAVTYGPILLRVPWQTLITDTYEIFKSPPVAHFSRHLNGLQDWPATGYASLAAVGIILCFCGFSALLAILVSGQRGQLSQGEAQPAWGAIVFGLPLWIYVFKFHGTVVDPNPLKASPLVLLMIITVIGWRWWKERAKGSRLEERDEILLIIALFGLISLMRVFLNVSLKNSYTPFTVPTVIIVYLYLFFHISPALLLPAGRLRENAKLSAMAIVAVSVIALVVTYTTLSRERRTYEISTSRGRFLTVPSLGHPLAEAIRYAEQHTSPGDYLLSFPQGTSINFLINRPYPLREESIVPGFLTGAREADAIRRISDRRVPLILIGNLLTPEYRDRTFGVDYNQDLMNWILEHYHLVATFSNSNDREHRLGEVEFFILAYERNP
ncbi:MAG: glycosyltransferase family 39 protein [Acidobacteria bacterium]|nr:glycosyltransferase family 39 protein [Acidobacteriota bacterium]